ncbi:iron complex outermembrane receptor protein [Ereboglobus sp. PH5-5]|uniref:hypothetical protein n=1 Tax=Ereboglobus sp. PH5-5 TaxID=2940529 RepID=UPI0024051B24|nr:hypothetical protein [Ereboglobus sp. PH5-5]MDF9832612.1 iron complex outermembrane receptor protein [Ereboglobus sp. PH5-5]
MSVFLFPDKARRSPFSQFHRSGKILLLVLFLGGASHGFGQKAGTSTETPAETNGKTVPVTLAAATETSNQGKKGSGDNSSSTSSSTPAAAAENTIVLDTYTVKASREGGVVTEGPQPVQTYDSAQISDSGAFSMEDFLEDLPPAEDGDEVLILIDGQPAHIDPETIPLDMIERVQVSLYGSIPELGAYAQGKVINIILKKDYVGGDIGERIRVAAAGGGFHQYTKFSMNVTKRRWSYFLSGVYWKTNELLASSRELSRNQDHTYRDGTDMRLAWGTPGVVQAASGNLAGIVDSGGNPVASALVPENQNGLSLTASDFLAGDTALSATAYGQRRFNTSEYRMLIAPTRRHNLNGSVTYKRGDRFRISLSGNYTETKVERIGAPPVTAASSKTLVPAAHNPFGQDVYVGLVHTEFGPTRQTARTRNAQFGLKMSGKIGDITPPAPGQHSTAWNWSSSIGYQRYRSRTIATDLDKDAFTASLASDDPALRFNPFGDPALGPVNAHLYPGLTVYRTRLDDITNVRYNAAANGPLVILPGGPLRLALAAAYHHQDRDRENTNATSGNPARTEKTNDSGAGSASLNVPLFGRTNTAPLLRRLETSASYWQNMQSQGNRRRSYAGGLVWSPARSLLLRARYSVYENKPAKSTFAGSESLVTETFIDRARDDETVTDVTVFTRGSISAVTSKSETQTLGFTLEPTFLKGLRFSATHNIRQRHRIYQSSFSAQEIINNESSFPGRVIRDDPTPADIANGHPGRITRIDTTPGNTGEAEVRDLRFSLEYRLPRQQYGRIMLRAYATHVIDSDYQVFPGVDYTYRSTSGNNPPEWTFQGQASWNHKGWNTVIRVNHTGPRMNAPIDDPGNPSYTTMNFDLSYQFQKPIIGKFGRRLRIGVGIANCFDVEPLYADTVSGYRTGSPLGRMYTCSLTLPM